MPGKKIKKPSTEGTAPTTYSTGTPPASLVSSSKPKTKKVRKHSGSKAPKANYHGAGSARSSIRRAKRRG